MCAVNRWLIFYFHLRHFLSALILYPRQVSSVLEALEDSGEYRTSAKPLVLGSLVKRGAEESQVRVIGELK